MTNGNGRTRLLAMLGACVALSTAWGVIGMTIDWSRTNDGYGLSDYGQDVAMDSQGAVITVGRFTAAKAFDGYIVKRDADATLAWAEVLDNPTATATSEDAYLAVCTGPDDAVYAAGIWSGTYGTEGFNQAVLVMKWLGDGTFDWGWDGGSAYGPWSGANDVCLDASGNVYLAGNATLSTGAGHRWGIWKLDSNGDPVAGFPLIHDVVPGTVLPDIANAVGVDDAGAIIAAGVVGVSGAAPMRDIDAHVRKWNADRSPAWDVTYAGTASLMDYASGLTMAANGDVYVVGYTNVGTDNSTNIDWDGLIMKIARDGTVLWTKTFASEAGWSEVFQDVVLDERGNPVVAGYRKHLGSSLYQGWIGVYDADGTLLDEEIFEQAGDLAFVGIARNELSYAVAGRVPATGGRDIYTARMDRPPYPNNAPTIDTPPTVNTDIAAVDEEVTFGVEASDLDDDPLTITWDFGDGTNGTGATPQHVYAAPGEYMAYVYVDDGTDQATAQVGVTVGGRLFETKVKARLNFKKPGKDKAIYQCGFVLADDFDPELKMVTFDLAGVKRSFVLNAKGIGKTDSGKAKLKFKKKKGYWRLDITLFKGSYAQAWEDEGLLNETVKNVPRRMKSKVTVGEVRCAHVTEVSYKAKAGKWGRTK